MPLSIRAGLAAVTLAALVVTGCSAAPAQSTTTPTATPTAAPSAAPPVTATGEVALPDVVERLLPSVVTVRTQGGVGSGVVYRPDVVITNQHVVGGARDVTLEFADGTTSPATVIATDAVTDLAVVRSARGDLPVPQYRAELPGPARPSWPSAARTASRAPSPPGSSPRSAARSPAPPRSPGHWST